jgi:hypothetical protein
MGDSVRRLISEGIEGAPHCVCAQSKDVGVDHGRLDVGVVKELLNRPDVGAGLEQMCRERVSQRVWNDLFFVSREYGRAVGGAAGVRGGDGVALLTKRLIRR